MSSVFKTITERQSPFLIAEIGVNFYDIARYEGIAPIGAAFLMIDAAARAGANAAKFQSYKAGKLAVKNSPAYWDLSEEPSRNQFDLFSKFDAFNAEDYKKCADHCSKAGIMFLSTPFDFEAADYLDELCPLFKVSSSDLTNWPFLEHIARKNKPVFLSTGASDINEIKGAVKVLEENGSGEICLLHCVLSYPTKYEDANLNMIKHLKKEFPGHLIGYSDHTLPDKDMACLITAWKYGAHVLEKHFTLDKTLKGNDHYHAMDADDIEVFKENTARKDFKADTAFIEVVSGQEQKHCLPCEEAARLNARRSIVAKSDIAKGEVITPDKLTFKRPGNGMPPSNFENLLGKHASADISADQILTMDLFLKN